MESLRLPPWERWTVQLTCDRHVRLPLFHGAELRRLLLEALRAPMLPPGVVPFAAESGRVELAPGDRYRFGLTLVGEARGLLPDLLCALANPSRAAPAGAGATSILASTLRNARAKPLPDPDLVREAAGLAGRGEIELRFLSPLRLPLPPRLRARRQRWFGERCSPAGPLLFEMRRRVAAFTGWCPALAASAEAGVEAVATCRPLVGLTVGPCGGSRAPGPSRRFHGVQGRVELRGLSEQFLPILLAARYLQVGQAIPFGFGRFDLPDLAPVAAEPWRPSRTLLSGLASPGALAAALDRTLPGDPATGVSAGLVEGLARALARREYVPAPLRRRSVPKPGGGLRQLAIPTLADRVVQRAAHDLLSPALDPLFAGSSHGFRPGRSRFDAAREIASGRARGRPVALDADIETFFDAVPWPRLLARLDALLPREPLLDLIAAWISAPVLDRGRRWERTGGLPQGSPISPLLANFVLDELDQELAARKAWLVRYADDFAVLCRDRAEATRRQREVAAALSRLGLRLNPEKTRIRDFADGWTFLGFLVCGSLVVPRSRPGGEGRRPRRPARAARFASSAVAADP